MTTLNEILKASYNEIYPQIKWMPAYAAEKRAGQWLVQDIALWKENKIDIANGKLIRKK